MCREEGRGEGGREMEGGRGVCREGGREMEEGRERGREGRGKVGVREGGRAGNREGEKREVNL